MIQVNVNWQNEFQKIEKLATETVDSLVNYVPDNWKKTAMVNVFAWRYIPLIAFLTPKVEELNDDRTVVRIPLNWRSRNHLGAMYFGALGVGADLAGGVVAMNEIEKLKPTRFDFVFQSVHGQFHKRAEDDVQFVCTDTEKIRQTVTRADETGQRESCDFEVEALVPTQLSDQPAATFRLTFSVKRR